MKVTFSGGRELERALRELGSLRRVTSALTRSGKRALQPIAEATRQRVPRDTEELAKGVTVRRLTRRQGGSADAVSLGVVFTGPHRTLAHLYEFGFTKRNGETYPAQPFLRPAWDGGRAQALADFGRELWAFLKRAAKRARRH